MRMILARHGKATHNMAFEAYAAGGSGGLHGLSGLQPEAAELVGVGVRQAREAGEYLRRHDLTPDIAFVSPALRTRQTWAEYRLPITPILDRRLLEQDGGLFDRLALAETQERRDRYAREAARDPDARPPDGESVRDHLARVQSWLREVTTRYPAVTVLAITHYGSFGLLGMLCEGLSLQQYLAARPGHLAPGCGDVSAYDLRGHDWERIAVFRNPCR